ACSPARTLPAGPFHRSTPPPADGCAIHRRVADTPRGATVPPAPPCLSSRHQSIAVPIVHHGDLPHRIMIGDHTNVSDALIQPDHIDAGRAHALAGLLDRDDLLALGEPLPLLWHLVYFIARPAQADLGQDGHPIIGFPTPPREGMRRMFAGGRVTTTSGLCVGDDALATTRVSLRTDKQGRTGPIHLVTTRTDITVGDRLAVVDERDIVYLEPASSTGEPPHADDDNPPLDMITRNSLAHRRVTVDPVLLFRF